MVCKDVVSPYTTIDYGKWCGLEMLPIGQIQSWSVVAGLGYFAVWPLYGPVWSMVGLEWYTLYSATIHCIGVCEPWCGVV